MTYQQHNDIPHIEAPLVHPEEVSYTSLSESSIRSLINNRNESIDLRVNKLETFMKNNERFLSISKCWTYFSMAIIVVDIIANIIIMSHK